MNSTSEEQITENIQFEKYTRISGTTYELPYEHKSYVLCFNLSEEHSDYVTFDGFGAPNNPKEKFDYVYHSYDGIKRLRGQNRSLREFQSVKLKKDGIDIAERENPFNL